MIMSTELIDAVKIKMLAEHNLPCGNISMASAVRPRNRKRLAHKTQRALEISDHFFDIVNEPPIDEANPANRYMSLEDTIVEVRYRMGTGTMTWLLIRWFVVPIIEWLWRYYFTQLCDTARDNKV